MKPHLRLIQFIGLIVPQRLRADWRQEWEAELRYREAMLAEWNKLDWQNKLALWRRSFGALWDALLLQPRRWEDEMMQDLRLGLRMLRTQPGFTVVAVLALALGIGATTLIFSVVNAVLLRPLPLSEAERVVRIGEAHNGSEITTAQFSYANFLDLGEQTETLESIAASRFWFATLTDNGEPEQVAGTMVSANYFATLGATPLRGRTFTKEEDQPNAASVVLLSHALWQSRFGSDETIIGKTIQVSGNSTTVVGVMPPGFAFPGQSKLWVPLRATGSLRNNRRSHLLQVVGRLRPNATQAQAEAELEVMAARIEQQAPGVDPNLKINAVNLQANLVAPLRPALLVLLGAVGFLLLIACANVANLLLARAASREKEMAIRAALGAGRWRLARQLLIESVLLAGLGGVVGMLFAVWGTKLIAPLDPASFPRINEVAVDASVLGFALLVSLLTGILFGLAPVWQLPKQGLHATLKEGGRGSTGTARGRLRQALVVSEIALTLVLLIGAGLLINSFVKLMQVNRGFDSTNVLTVNVTLPFAKYDDDARSIAFVRQMLERVSAIPGVAAASTTTALPFSGGAATSFVIEGRPSVNGEKEPIADIRSVAANYFRTLAIPLRAGRVFTERDNETAPRVMIINEEMARRYWPNESPIGRRVTMKDWGDPLTGEVVGVVGDVKSDGLDADLRPMIYWPFAQFPNNFNNLVVRTAGDPLSVANAVKTAVWSVDAAQPLASLRTMEDVIANSIAPRRFNLLLLGSFAALALLLASVGIYGVMAYTVSQRTHEIGIRMALGASRRSVLRLILRQGLRLTGIGIALGLLAAMLLTRLLQSLLYGVSVTDPLTFAGVAFLLAAVSLLACWIPARRATKVDPLMALRHE
ncbi:MAG: ABC transporter permease [Acidobacteriota bacterium]|nr:ABC transporter permease [Acidobacteriota bacterium]